MCSLVFCFLHVIQKYVWFNVQCSLWQVLLVAVIFGLQHPSLVLLANDLGRVLSVNNCASNFDFHWLQVCHTACMKFDVVWNHSLTTALDQLRVVASSTSNDPGPQSEQVYQRRYVSRRSSKPKLHLKNGEKRFSIWRMEFLPCNVARSWHWFRQMTAPCRGSGMTCHWIRRGAHELWPSIMQ